MVVTDKIDEILEYWFGDGSTERGLWFKGSQEIDDDIRQRFGDLWERAGRGDVDYWCETARGRMALIIVLDQFSRNLHRGSPLAFQYDNKAQSLSLQGIELGHDIQLGLFERWFFYLPLEHAENLALQDKSIACFQTLLADAPLDKRQIFEGSLGYAERHRAVIEKFGRFPHRNELLGRESTEAERAHLASGVWF